MSLKCLAVHPGPLMYTKIYLTLEPLGLELVAEAARQAGHEVRLVDLQIAKLSRFIDELQDWRPDAVCVSGNYLANVPEIVDLATIAKSLLPNCFVFAGGHSISFTARELLEHAGGAIDCVLRGEGEASVALLLDAAQDGGLDAVPGAVTLTSSGPP